MKFIKLEKMQDEDFENHYGVDSDEMPALICENNWGGVTWIVIVDCKGLYIEKYVDDDNHQSTPADYKIPSSKSEYETLVKKMNRITVSGLERILKASGPINI